MLYYSLLYVFFFNNYDFLSIVICMFFFFCFRWCDHMGHTLVDFQFHGLTYSLILWFKIYYYCFGFNFQLSGISLKEISLFILVGISTFYFFVCQVYGSWSDLCSMFEQVPGFYICFDNCLFACIQKLSIPCEHSPIELLYFHVWT